MKKAGVERKGTIVSWNENRGIGVIHEEVTKTPVIVHHSAIKNKAGIKNLEIGGVVVFSCVVIEGREVANNVVSQKICVCCKKVLVDEGTVCPSCEVKLESNSGFNPELLSDTEFVTFAEGNKVVIFDIESETEKSFYRTEFTTCLEYITEYSGIYGKEIDGVFYCEEC